TEAGTRTAAPSSPAIRSGRAIRSMPTQSSGRAARAASPATSGRLRAGIWVTGYPDGVETRQFTGRGWNAGATLRCRLAAAGGAPACQQQARPQRGRRGAAVPASAQAPVQGRAVQAPRQAEAGGGDGTGLRRRTALDQGALAPQVVDHGGQRRGLRAAFIEQ